MTPEAMIAKLVSFDTTSSRSNLPLVEFVVDYLKGLGLAPVTVPNAEGDKATLFVTIGPSETGGVMLSGHSDCVPVEGQAWSRDPFTLHAEGGKLYGRGACDMKGFVGTVLAMVPHMQKAALTTPIHIIIAYDEEVGCQGSLDTIARFGIDLPAPRLCIVGEPTDMTVVDAHKSLAAFDTTVTGLEAHSSKPGLGANALVAAAELVGELDRLRAEWVERGDPTGRFDPAFTSIHVGTFRSGTARNIVPNHANFAWEVRGLPGVDETEVARRLDAYAEAAVLPHMRKNAPAAAVKTIQLRRVPGLAPEPGSIAETVALRLALANRTFAVPYATEAGQFQKAGIPTVVCGPGSIDQAHKPDEWIADTEIKACTAFLERLVEACSGR